MRALRELVGGAYAWIDAAYKTCDARLRGEFVKATPEELAGMEDALMHIPHTTDAHEVLRRY